MSKDIVVLTPNARRVTVHCSPDTIILQILEDVCTKQGLNAGSYNLKHHNKMLDLSISIRFSNLPNKACLEMVETDQQRQETMVTIGLQLEDGERHTGDFLPSTSLFDVVSSLATTELNKIDHPTVLYMRQEIFGLQALKEKSLRQLGLLGGRAILRLLDKSADEIKTQANVSSVFKSQSQPSPNDEEKLVSSRSKTEEVSTNNTMEPNAHNQGDKENTGLTVDPIKLIKQCKLQQNDLSLESKQVNNDGEDVISKDSSTVKIRTAKIAMVDTKETDSSVDTALLERRLKIEEEVTFIGSQKAIAFTPFDSQERSIEDLPDDFYDLSIEEIRKLYRDLQVKRSDLENAPLLTASKRDATKQNTESQINYYKNVVVRIQFPDNIILQGVFVPTNTIEDITSFVKQFLRTSEEPFNIYTTTIKGTMEPTMSLIDAKFVPCVHLHFKWLTKEDDNEPCLKENIYASMTSSDAASILASKYRAPSRRKLESQISDREMPSTSKNSKVPKWFKK